MAYLVLCADHDVAALWAFRKLQEAGLPALELVTSAALAMAKTWVHELGSSGVHLELELDDGRHFFSAQIRGVLNRLLMPPQEVINHVVAEDREYVSGELSAFYL